MKRVAILGFAPSWVDAPFGDASIDIWTMNYHHEDLPRADRVFELHGWALLEKEDTLLPPAQRHLPKLATVTAPVFMQAVRPEIPASVRYPIEQVSEAFALPDTERAYLTNSASYMIALAILEGYEAIDCYGLNMAHDSEYGQQRPSCEFFLGVAIGRGIQVTVHRHSDLLKTAFLYAYEDERKNWFRGKLLEQREHLAKMHNEHVGQADHHKLTAAEFSGAIQQVDHILKLWAEGS